LILGGAEFVQEFGEVVVDGFPFAIIAGGWVHGFGEVILVVGEALFDVGDDLGWSWIATGYVNADLVAARFERWHFGVVICTVHMRALFFTALE
jgi:hypothetical protein